MPAPTPVTSPVVVTVATEVLLLLQMPPVVASVNWVVLLTHTPDAPAMAATTGKGFTVTEVLATAVQPLLFVRV